MLVTPGIIDFTFSALLALHGYKIEVKNKRGKEESLCVVEVDVGVAVWRSVGGAGRRGARAGLRQGAEGAAARVLACVKAPRAPQLEPRAANGDRMQSGHRGRGRERVRKEQQRRRQRRRRRRRHETEEEKENRSESAPGLSRG